MNESEEIDENRKIQNKVILRHFVWNDDHYCMVVKMSWMNYGFERFIENEDTYQSNKSTKNSSNLKKSVIHKEILTK